jgi:hypothetical protein
MNKIFYLLLLLLLFHKVEAESYPVLGGNLSLNSSRKLDSLVQANQNALNFLKDEPTEPKLIIETKKMIGIKTNWAFSGLEYTNSKNHQLIYSKPLNIGSGVSFYLRRRFVMLEMGASYAQINSTYKTLGLISTISLHQTNVECIPSLLLFTGPTRVKVGSGISASYTLKGTQYNNGLDYDLLKDTYKRFSVSSISELGFVFLPKRYVMIQVVAFYSIGLSNIEKNENQTSKINGYGISTGLSFTL